MDERLRRTSALSLVVVSICACQGPAQLDFPPLPVEDVIPVDVVPQAGRNLPNQCPSISESSRPTVEPQVVAVNAGQNVIVTVSPSYPAVAQERCISGWAAFEFAISADGQVQNPQLIAMHPETIFQTASLRALRKWKYKPVNGEAQTTAFGGCALFFFQHPLHPLNYGADVDPFPLMCPYPTPEHSHPHGPFPRGPLLVPLPEVWIPLLQFE
jgi:TonB family protein